MFLKNKHILLVSYLQDEQKSKENDGVFAVAGVEVHLKRYTTRFVFTYYCPLFAMVLVSWINFCVPPDAVPGRVGLLVTTFLVLVTMFGNIQALNGIYFFARVAFF